MLYVVSNGIVGNGAMLGFLADLCWKSWRCRDSQFDLRSFERSSYSGVLCDFYWEIFVIRQVKSSQIAILTYSGSGNLVSTSFTYCVNTNCKSLFCVITVLNLQLIRFLGTRADSTFKIYASQVVSLVTAL